MRSDMSGTLIADATGKYKAAEAADAKNFAPYEYYAAEEYLHKAREKESYSQYQRAVDYGKKALEFATKALENPSRPKAAYIQPVPQQAKPQAQPPAASPAPARLLCRHRTQKQRNERRARSGSTTVNI